MVAKKTLFNLKLPYAAGPRTISMLSIVKDTVLLVFLNIGYKPQFEARRAEGPPSVARFINLSRGVRARIAKGGQISIGPYIFRWCPHSCLATKPNRDRWQLCTLMFLRRVSSFLACFAAFIWVLICLFIVCEQASNAWLNKWLKIHSGGDLQLKLSVNADLKFSANNEGERVDDKKARV